MTRWGSVMRRLCVPRATCALIVLTLLALLLLTARAGSSTSLTITADQGLSPDFSLAMQGYTVRCTNGATATRTTTVTLS